MRIEPDIVGTVPLDSPMVPAPGVHRYAVVSTQTGHVLMVQRGNGMRHALTYRTHRGAAQAVEQFGTGKVLDRLEAHDG